MSPDPHVGPPQPKKQNGILILCLLLVVLGIGGFTLLACGLTNLQSFGLWKATPTVEPVLNDKYDVATYVAHIVEEDYAAVGQPTPVRPVAVIPTVMPTTASLESLPMPNIVRQPTIALTSQGSMPDLPINASHGKWEIWLNADIDLDPIVKQNMANLEDANPHKGKTFPNIPNPDRPDFKSEPGKPAPWGAEYGVAESPFCENNPCDWVISANSYRLVSADYSFLGHECRGDGKTGCLIIVVNVMDKSVVYRNQAADNGFTVPGRYWDGRVLEKALWGLVSHASANMLGMETYSREGEILNAGTGGSNAGANCGNATACQGVDATIIIVAGDRVLARAHTIVTR